MNRAPCCGDKVDCNRFAFICTWSILSVKYYTHYCVDVNDICLSASHSDYILTKSMSSLCGVSSLVFSHTGETMNINGCLRKKKRSGQSRRVQNGPQHFSILLGYPFTSNQHIPLCWVSDPVWLIVVSLCTPLLCARLGNDRKETQMNNACLYQPILQEKMHGERETNR